MSNPFTSGAYDRWATGGRYHKDIDATAYCHNVNCAEYGVPQSVTYEEEYGAGTVTPEECPACHEPWPRYFDEKPPEREEEE